jgi:hypothetical protein
MKSAALSAGIRSLRRIAPRQDLTFHLGPTLGRLGNQLFQIAGTYAIASRMGVGVVLREDWPYRSRFSVPDSWFASRFEVLRCTPAWCFATSIEREWRTYLQDLGLWGGLENEIRRLLQPSQYVRLELAERYGELLALPSKTALHVRRGDYVTGNTMHRPCPISYYEQALSLIAAEEPTTSVFVFSDDIGWCRQNLPAGRDAIYIEGNPDWLDLAFMSRCEYHICANSTFSWWGAFLSGDPSPIVPWLVGVFPDALRRIHPPSWREIEIDVATP